MALETSAYLDGYYGFFKSVETDLLTFDNEEFPPKAVLKEDRIGLCLEWAFKYLKIRKCPPALLTPLARQALDIVENMKEESTENFVIPNMVEVVNQVCLLYCGKDNPAVKKLPPPSSLPAVSTCGIKNSPRRMEDRHVVVHDLDALFNVPDSGPSHYYGVFDGHCGSDAATYCANHLHVFLTQSKSYPSDPEAAFKDAFKVADQQYCKKNLECGTTAVCALYRPKSKKLYVAWAGDSPATLVGQRGFTELTNPHKPNRRDEFENITKMGGSVLFYGCWRVNGQLAVSRAIGDANHKPFVSAEPEITCIDLDGSEDFIVLGSDGLWDELTSEMIVGAVYQQLEQDPNDLPTVSVKLCALAREHQSQDNITAVVVFLRHPSTIVRPACCPELPSEAPSAGMDILDNIDNMFMDRTPTINGINSPSEELDTAVSTNRDDHKKEGGEDDDDDEEDLPETSVDVDDFSVTNLSDSVFSKQEMVALADGADAEDLSVSPEPLIEPLPDKVPNEESGEESEEEWNYYSGENKGSADIPKIALQPEADTDMSNLNPEAAVFVPHSPVSDGPAKEGNNEEETKGEADRLDSKSRNECENESSLKIDSLSFSALLNTNSPIVSSTPFESETATGTAFPFTPSPKHPEEPPFTNSGAQTAMDSNIAYLDGSDNALNTAFNATFDVEESPRVSATSNLTYPIEEIQNQLSVITEYPETSDCLIESSDIESSPKADSKKSMDLLLIEKSDHLQAIAEPIPDLIKVESEGPEFVSETVQTIQSEPTEKEVNSELLEGMNPFTIREFKKEEEDKNPVFCQTDLMETEDLLGVELSIPVIELDETLTLSNSADLLQSASELVFDHHDPEVQAKEAIGVEVSGSTSEIKRELDATEVLVHPEPVVHNEPACQITERKQNQASELVEETLLPIEQQTDLKQELADIAVNPEPVLAIPPVEAANVTEEKTTSEVPVEVVATAAAAAGGAEASGSISGIKSELDATEVFVHSEHVVHNEPSSQITEEKQASALVVEETPSPVEQRTNFEQELADIAVDPEQALAIPPVEAANVTEKNTNTEVPVEAIATAAAIGVVAAVRASVSAAKTGVQTKTDPKKPPTKPSLSKVKSAPANSKVTSKPVTKTTTIAPAQSSTSASNVTKGPVAEPRPKAAPSKVERVPIWQRSSGAPIPKKTLTNSSTVSEKASSSKTGEKALGKPLATKKETTVASPKPKPSSSASSAAVTDRQPSNRPRPGSAATAAGANITTRKTAEAHKTIASKPLATARVASARPTTSKPAATLNAGSLKPGKTTVSNAKKGPVNALNKASSLGSNPVQNGSVKPNSLQNGSVASND